MEYVLIYAAGLWTACLGLVALIQQGYIRVAWPKLETVTQYNRFVKWIGLGGGVISFVAGICFSLDPTFDQTALVELLASLTSLIGFLVATFSVLAGPALKQFLSQYILVGIQWLLIAGPTGLMFAGMIMFAATHGQSVFHTGMALFACMGPTNLMIEWAGKHKTTEETLNWVAATLVLLGALVQTSVALAKFMK